MMLNVLERQNGCGNQEAGRVKYLHLNSQNAKLLQRIRQLQGQIISLKKVNELLQNCSKYPLDPVVSELKQQIRNLEESVARLMKTNDQLECNALMKTQLICQNQNEFKQILNNYEEKILELRIKCQTSELLLSQMHEHPLGEKEQEYGTSTQLNLMCFNQINELRMMLNRFNLQNAELKCVISKKEQENSKIKDQLNQCELAIKSGDDWHTYKQSLCDSTKMKNSMVNNDLLLNEQLTRHSQKSKIAAAILKTSGNPAMEMNKLKALVIKYSQENINLKEEIKKLQRSLGLKNSQQKQLKEACRKLEQTIKNNKVQMEFYRNNFKELTKVTKERKIQYYDQFYEAQLPSLRRKQQDERESIIHYWKEWAQMHGTFAEKLTLKSKTSHNHRHRNRSCPSKMLQTPDDQNKSKICTDKFEQESILGFIDEIHDIGSQTNPEFEHQLKESDQCELNSLQDAFSMIVKPTEPALMGQFSIRQSHQFVELDIDLDD